MPVCRPSVCLLARPSTPGSLSRHLQFIKVGNLIDAGPDPVICDDPVGFGPRVYGPSMSMIVDV